MARRLTPQQAVRKLNKAEKDRQSAIRDYNSRVKKYNAEAKRYNRQQSAQASRLDSAIKAYNREIRRANANRTVRVELRESNQVVRDRFVRIEETADEWFGELAANDAANSVEALDLFENDEPDSRASGDLQINLVTEELTAISEDLHSRWEGALFALSPKNPDAARHFCTSAREVVIQMIDTEASDSAVLKHLPDCEKIPSGAPTRKAKIDYLLQKRGMHNASMIDFVDSDIDDVLALFRVFNNATHGSAGKYDLNKLSAIKIRVEGAIRLLSYLVSQSGPSNAD